MLGSSSLKISVKQFDYIFTSFIYLFIYQIHINFQNGFNNNS